jgi:AGZA family xanthine/uracil permease-like MFS transporter
MGASFLLTAVFAFVEGFWVLPEAPGLLPEGLEKVFGQAMLCGPWAESHLGEYFLLGLVMFLAVNAESWAVWQALPQGQGASAPVLKGLAGFSFLGAFAGCLPLSLSPLSAVGWTAGGRRGRTVAVALCALAVLWFLEPAVAEIASFPAMTVPLLLLAGVDLIRQQLRDFNPGELAFEAFMPGLTGAILMALSFDIAAGVGSAVISHVLLFAAAGRRRETRPAEWGLALLFLLYFIVGYL